jgi:beta-N-acetylhexosaminidase
MKIIKATSKCFILFFIAFVVTPNLSAQKAADSLDFKIGQMILIGFPGRVVDDKVLEEVRQGKVGSIIIFEKNIPQQNSYIELKKIIWQYQAVAPVPLLIAIDQEGGRVNRLKEKYNFPRSLSAAELGKYSLDSIRFYSEATAATLAGLGINVNFAPVVDLAINPTNPIIAKVERAYSAQPDSVTLYASEFIKSHRKMGVISVLKHFPGHGSSRDDTHLGIADVSNTWKSDELLPYKQLIDKGYVDAIMTAHIVNRNLDSAGNPGTLSNQIISGILRKQLQFNGVVFSDDMQMHAIAKHYGLEEAIKLAILAGVDILTFSNNIQGSQERTVDVVHEIIRKFVQEGVIPKTRIDQSYARIVALKQRLSADNNEKATLYQKTDSLLLKVEQLESKLQEAEIRLKGLESRSKKRKNRKN